MPLNSALIYCGNLVESFERILCTALCCIVRSASNAETENVDHRGLLFRLGSILRKNTNGERDLLHRFVFIVDFYTGDFIHNPQSFCNFSEYRVILIQ
jgi:hypothetical protein